jgi:hypothetical protein
MTTQHSRQARRASRCVEARSPRGSEPTDRHELAQVAARIAGELELSPEKIHDLLFGAGQGTTARPLTFLDETQRPAGAGPILGRHAGEV